MKKIKKSRAHLVLLDDINYDKMFMWYLESQTHQDDVFCIINNNKYVGIITYLDVIFIVDVYELELIAYKNYNKVLNEDIENIDTLLNTDCNWKNIKPIINVIYDEDEIDKILQNYKIVCNKLVENNVNLIKVKIPSETQLLNKINRLLWLSSKSCYTDVAKQYIKPLLKLISNNSYDELKMRFLNEKPEYEKEIFSNRIFIIGPCIVRGVNTPNDSVLCKLYHKLTQIGFDVTNIPIIVWRYESDKIYELMKYNLTNKDIVLMIEEEQYFGKIGKNDIDMCTIMNKYKGGVKYLYYDKPIHATVFGVELIVNEIIKKITPILQSTKNIKEKILLEASNIAEQQEQQMIEVFIDNIKNKIVEYGTPKNIGSIVMNANPFTKGHKHLVEIAANDVDLLIVFVVEEDESFVPFKDRFELVCKGISDLENVLVVPSGHFIISKTTFKNYFEKETIKDSVIDATKDITIFGEKIAKALNITKRYVGEEPFDKVTYQYNQQMKQQLKEYNVELVEIPRVQLDYCIISASYVRKLLIDNIEEIKKLVPYTTYHYLVSRKEFLFRRELCRNMLKEKIKEKGEVIQEIHNISQVKSFIKVNKKVVIYGMGIDALLLIKELDEEDMKYITFSDRLALSKNIEFLNLQVISPQKLITNKYCDYKIIIASREFYIEIYKYLRDMGIDIDRIFILE